MFECHVRFERIFASKILTWAVAVTETFHEKGFEMTKKCIKVSSFIIVFKQFETETERFESLEHQHSSTTILLPILCAVTKGNLMISCRKGSNLHNKI